MHSFSLRLLSRRARGLLLEHARRTAVASAPHADAPFGRTGTQNNWRKRARPGNFAFMQTARLTRLYCSGVGLASEATSGAGEKWLALTPRQLLADVPSKQLAVSVSIYNMCGNDMFIEAVISALRAAEQSPMLGAPAMSFVKNTVFRHFCAGEKMDDVMKVKDYLERVGGVKLLVDHSVEEREDPKDWEANLSAKKRLLRDCREKLSDGVAFVPIKATALISPAMLESMTSIIQDLSDSDSPSSYLDLEVDPRVRMSCEELVLLDRVFENMSELCTVSMDLGLPLLLDAEQSHRQPAVDFICRRLQQQFNKKGERNVIYNTYQMYMVGAERRLARDLAHAKQEAYGFAAKVVRGAYLVHETERAESLGQPSAILPMKSDTDSAYDRGVDLLLASLAKGEPTSCIIATHNVASIKKAVTRMEELRIPSQHPSVNFAQIMGMCDLLTLALGKGGYNSHKLVLFGSFHELFPWLLRRLDENRDLLGATQRELPLLKDEMTRRMRNTRIIEALLKMRKRKGDET